ITFEVKTQWERQCAPVHHPWTYRAMGGETLSFIPLSVIMLQIPGGDIVCYGITENIILSIFLGNVHPLLADYDRQLYFVIHLGGDMAVEKNSLFRAYDCMIGFGKVNGMLGK